jgi:hypothetical protein
MMDDIATEIAALDQMSTGDLTERYAELHGQPCRTRHRAYLIRKIAWRLQANAEGGLSERARQRAAELADDAEVRVMAPKTMICPPQNGEVATVTMPAPTGRGKSTDPRLPAPGSAIVRKYKGRVHRVVFLKDGSGFEYEGDRYRTLTAVAKRITRSHINGLPNAARQRVPSHGSRSRPRHNAAAVWWIQPFHRMIPKGLSRDGFNRRTKMFWASAALSGGCRMRLQPSFLGATLVGGSHAWSRWPPVCHCSVVRRRLKVAPCRALLPTSSVSRQNP